MSLIESIILGLIQGLAEFLPISSSGHLAILEEVLNIKNGGMFFDVMLHFGTLIAIFIAFFSDIKKLFFEGIHILCDAFINVTRFFTNITKSRDEKREYVSVIDSPYRRFVILIIISSIPTAIIGALFKNIVEEVSGNLIVVGICLIVTSIILYIADITVSGHKRANKVRYMEAGFIGVVQGFATLPGISRSGATITAGLLCGFDRAFAVKYSFIMSIPAVIGAVILELKDFQLKAVSGKELLNYSIGTLVATVTGLIAIKTMVVVVKKKKYKVFSYYCFIIGLLSIIWFIV